VLGILKGFDQMMNVVLENCVEYLRLVDASCMMMMATECGSGAAEASMCATNCDVIIRDPADPTILTDKTRHLGLVVCKGR
jgi:small nuclear ribonucleoprotein (snRNP)-like protein